MIASIVLERACVLNFYNSLVRQPTLKSNFSEEDLLSMADMIRVRMKGRGFAVCSNHITRPIIEQSFKDGVDLLEAHLRPRKYLLGERPCFGGANFWFLL